MKGKKRKCLSFLLCVSLILGMIPMTEKTVKAATELITSVEVMLARPFNTAKPCSKEDVLIFGANDRYVVGSLTWYEGTYNSYQQTRDLSVFNGSFMSGMAYTAVLNLHSKPGYEFSCDDSGIPDISEDNIAVNCNNVTLDKASSGSQNLRLYLNYGSKANILDDTKGNCFKFTWAEDTGTLTLSPWNESGIIVDYEDIFAGNSKIKKVVMEEGVTSIGDDAFAYCNNINTVSIPSTLEKWGCMSEATIQKYTVADDNRLYQVREDNSLYSKDGKVLIDCAGNDNSTTYEVPEGVEKIGSFAFDGGNSLVKLTLQGENLVLEDYALFHPYIEFIEIKEGVKSLGKNSSVGGVIINEIDLPSTVIDIGNFFKGLPTIQKINVAEENSIYKDVDGVVIRKQDGALVCYPGGKTDASYRTPEGVYSIDKEAFYAHDYLKELEVGYQVQSVVEQALSNMKVLEKITFYNTECSIDSGMLFYCSQVNQICGKEDSTAKAYATNKGISFKAITCGATFKPLVPATDEMDGTKAHYVCVNCNSKYTDAAGSTKVTDEDLCIPKVASVAFSQNEYDYTTEYAKKAWGSYVVVKDAKGNQLVYGKDYSVEQIGENLFGVCKAKVTGKGNYNFEKEASCTVHPSSTLRSPADVNELNHGSDTVELCGDDKTCVINGDERVILYASIAALIMVDHGITPGSLDEEMTLDLDKDGSADLMMVMEEVISLCEGGAPIKFQVLPTCSITENKTFTLSEAAHTYLKTKALTPYYETITFQFVDPCAEGHSYANDNWSSDETNHWHECTVCGEKCDVHEHIPGAPATATTPQTCTECGRVLAPALGGITPTATPGASAAPTAPPGASAAPTTPPGASAAPTTPPGASAAPTATPGASAAPTVTPGASAAPTATPGTTAAPGIVGPTVAPTASSEESNASKVLTVGTKVVDKASKAQYKVTSSDASAPTVEFVCPESGAGKTISIPATLKKDGVTYKVTSIAKNAFRNNKKLTKVTIGKNIQTIGKCAFYGCKKLKQITIKTTLLTDKKVGSKAFKGIHKKAVFKVPKSKRKTYKSMLKKKGISKSVKIK